MALHSSTLAWKIPWMEDPGRLQSMGSLGVGHDWATSLSCIGEGNGNPLQGSCLENPRDRGAWWTAVCGVAQSWMRLKRLSSSSVVVQLLRYVQLYATPHLQDTRLFCPPLSPRVFSNSCPLIQWCKAHLTSYSRMSGSRWVNTSSWLSGSLRLFCIILLCILATSS